MMEEEHNSGRSAQSGLLDTTGGMFPNIITADYFYGDPTSDREPDYGDLPVVIAADMVHQPVPPALRDVNGLRTGYEMKTKPGYSQTSDMYEYEELLVVGSTAREWSPVRTGWASDFLRWTMAD